MNKKAKANVVPVRQQSQFSCVSSSTCMALNALGIECSEEQVNKVIGAKPMQGARWEEVLACAQYFGCRATLTTPATLTQVKSWTDQGKPVLIAWNPEGRDWSHASLIFDVTGERGSYVVHVADPNIPNPDKTVREVGEDEFYSKWFEKWPNYLVRRPALMIEKEIDGKGRQIMASYEKAFGSSRFISAVKKVISSIRHLGYPVRYDEWTSSVSQSNILLTFKVAAVGIGNYNLDFQWQANGDSIATFTEGREIVHRAVGEANFPKLMMHLPSRQFAKLASKSLFPCVSATTNLDDATLIRAIKKVPRGLTTFREFAVALANLLEKDSDFLMYDNSLSIIDVILKDLLKRMEEFNTLSIVSENSRDYPIYGQRQPLMLRRDYGSTNR